MKRRTASKIIALLLTAGLSVPLFTGCGCGKDEDQPETYEADQFEDYGEDTEAYEDTGEESPEEIPEEPSEYSTSNVIPEYDDTGVTPKPVTVDVYANYSAIDHAKEIGSMDYLEWLADYCVNVIEPQAVEKLLQVPAFKEAADQGLISKYITLQLDYNDQNQYGAMTRISYYNKNGCVIGEENDDEDCYNVGYSFLVNTCVFEPDTQNDPDKRRELQDTMIHEMMHAFTFDYTRGLMAGIYRDGHVNALENGAPQWFSEGVAVTMQGGYNDGRMGILEDMFLAEDEDKEVLLDTFSSPQSMWEAIESMYQYYSKEDIKEELGSEDARFTDINFEGNTYTYSYLGTMYVYDMAARSLGLETFDEQGRVNMDAMLKGLDYILRQSHAGYSLDEIFAEISKDPSTGVSLYPDVESLEKTFMRSADDPALAFSRKLMYDFESRTSDINHDLPCGSVLPGYYTKKQDFMDEKYHMPAEVFEVVNFPQSSESDDYYAVSTVRPSSTALTGMLHVSNVGEVLSDAEKEERDRLFIGDEIRFVNDTYGRDYKSADGWQKIDREDLYRSPEDFEATPEDAGNASYEMGFMASSDTSDNDYIMMALFKDSSHGDFAVMVTPEGIRSGKYSIDSASYPGKDWNGISLTLSDGTSVDYFENEGYAADGKGKLYKAQDLSEADARDFLDFAMGE